jgi:hypothetical protein
MVELRCFAWVVATLTLVATANPQSPVTSDARGFIDALVGPAAPPAPGAGADLYDPLLGSWDVEVVEHLPDGSRRATAGEWHFARVLEARAIQDVLVVPPIAARRQGVEPGPGVTYGTTLRVYRPQTGTWAVTWFHPVTGLEVRGVGRREGNEVMQEGTLPDGTPFRWIFSEMTSKSFRWRREVLRADGASWVLGIDMRGRRREKSPAGARRMQ